MKLMTRNLGSQLSESSSTYEVSSPEWGEGELKEHLCQDSTTPRPVGSGGVCVLNSRGSAHLPSFHHVNPLLLIIIQSQMFIEHLQ